MDYDEGFLRFKKANNTLYVSDKADEDGEVFLGINNNSQIFLTRDDARKLAGHLAKIYEPTEKPLRESGFYWVRANGPEWSVAEWSGKYGEWYLTYSDASYQDDEFLEIDERRVERCAEV